MNAKEIHQLLSVQDVGEAKEAALLFLNSLKDGETGVRSIFDHKTMRWQPTFEAGGKQYRIISPEEGLPLLRYKRLREALSVVGADATFGDQLAQISKLKGLVDGIAAQRGGIVDLSVILTNMEQAIHKAQRNWHFSAWAATLFIVTPGEDLTKYDEGQAEQKMRDWNEAGINGADFFFCCALWEFNTNGAYREFAERLAATA